ncbi:YbaY family lipoprotein [Zobellella denitrificans]|uniref:YbaY family lipoprotein n=1 Tax=Zobellella denitrificans TaxID=347534 RepID=UPI001595E645|nr:YbaY family lipoprotein [Zobellella denitrificans]
MHTLRLAPLALLFAFTLAGCSEEQAANEQAGTATLSGNLVYLPRIALPEDARASVRLEDVSLADAPAETLAEQNFATEGRQVPLPFSLEYDTAAIEPSHRYAVRGEIRDAAGTLLWTTTEHHGVLTQGQPGDDIEIRLEQVESAPAGPSTLVYRCTPQDGEPFEFVVQYHDGRLGLWLPDSFELPYQELPQVISASGARFENEQARVWSKGDTALLEVAGQDYGECVEDRAAGLREDARLRGVTLRATGNEPGWVLEVTAGQQIRFNYNYGANELLLPTPEALPDDAGYRAASADHRLEVSVSQERCQDDMSGEEFPYRVLVTLDDQQFRGCGTRLD